MHNLFYNGILSVGYDANISEGASPFGDFVLLAPVIGGLIVVFLVKRFAPEAKGHGVPEVMDAISYNRGKIRGTVALIKALASAVSIGSGGAVGRDILTIALPWRHHGGRLCRCEHLGSASFGANASSAAIVGMAAILGAGTGGVMTAIVMVFEMTRDYVVIG